MLRASPFRLRLSLAALAAALLLCALPRPASADEDRYVQAMRRMSEADVNFREGRLSDAFLGYLDLLKEFPTWWLVTLKAGITAHALRLPAETVSAWLDRARGQSPSGTYLPLVEGLLTGGVPRDPDRAGGRSPPVIRDPLADRMALLRAGRLASQGRQVEAESEYRAILSRSPAVLVARWRLARLLEDAGRGREAAALLREGAALSAMPARWRAEAARMERGDALDKPSDNFPK